MTQPKVPQTNHNTEARKDLAPQSIKTDRTPSSHQNAMSLLEHLDELRVRLIRSSLAILICFGLAIVFAGPVINFLKAPLIAALPTNAKELHFMGPMDLFNLYIKIGVLGGIILASPFYLYQFWRFFEPALYSQEKKYILPFSFISIALFLAGVIFCFVFIVPLSMDYLMGLSVDFADITPTININDYFSLLILMTVGFGVMFETPLILVLLALLDLISSKALTSNRSYVFVGILIFAAIFTPPDPISQIGLSIPLVFMFEIAVFIIKMIEKKRLSQQASL